MEQNFKVTSYLKARQEELGLEQIFGIVGNEAVSFINRLISHSRPPIKISTNSNDIYVFYSANTYSKLTEIGDLYIERCSFALFKDIITAYIPLVLHNCRSEQQAEKGLNGSEQNINLQAQEHDSVIEDAMFTYIASAAEHIYNLIKASWQMDSTLSPLLTQQKPLYLHINIKEEPCPVSEGERQPKSAPPTHYPSRHVAQACDILLQDLGKTPSITELAYSVGTNRNTLTQEFQKTFCLSPFAWLREQRLLKAKQLVAETDLPICHISANVGYPDSNHFSTCFKKRFGASPRALRKNVMQTKISMNETKVSQMNIR